jgi:hypothetical protein
MLVLDVVTICTALVNLGFWLHGTGALIYVICLVR